MSRTDLVTEPAPLTAGQAVRVGDKRGTVSQVYQGRVSWKAVVRFEDGRAGTYHARIPEPVN